MNSRQIIVVTTLSILVDFRRIDNTFLYLTILYHTILYLTLLDYAARRQIIMYIHQDNDGQILSHLPFHPQSVLVV